MGWAADGTWRTYHTGDGLADEYVNAIAVDSGGNRWFATNYGVSRLSSDNNTWTTYMISDGLIGNYVLDVAVESHGKKWFAGFGKGLGGGRGLWGDPLAGPGERGTWTSYTLTEIGRAHVWNPNKTPNRKPGSA